MKAQVWRKVRSAVAISDFLQDFGLFLFVLQLFARELDESVVQILDARLALERIGCSFGDQTPVRDEADAGAEAFSLGHIVRREQDGRAFACAQLFEKGLD